MGRKRNAVKATALQDLSPLEKLVAARYGESDPDALSAIRALHAVVFPDSCSQAPYIGPPGALVSPEMLSATVENDRERFLQYVTKEFRKGWKKGNGAFFRKLAVAMEALKTPVDPPRAAFLKELQQRSLFASDNPTVSQTHAAIAKQGIKISRKTVERFFRELGETPAPDKRGPKPGTKQNSVHRARKN